MPRNKGDKSKKYFLESDYYRLYGDSVQQCLDVTTAQTGWHVELISPKAGERVLDVGVGSGRFILACAETGAADVIGMDISLGALTDASEAKRRGTFRMTLIQADAEQLPFAEKSFDKVVCVLTSQYVPDKEALHAELGRVCKPGGRLLIDYPDESRPRVFIEQKMRWLFNAGLPMLAGLHLKSVMQGLFIFSARFIKRVMPNSGSVKYLDEATIISSFTYGVTPYYPLRKGQIKRLLDKNGFMELEFLSKFGHNLITVLAKKSTRID